MSRTPLGGQPPVGSLDPPGNGGSLTDAQERYYEAQDMATAGADPEWECPFCGKPLADEHAPCCGETGHGQAAGA